MSSRLESSSTNSDRARRDRIWFNELTLSPMSLNFFQWAQMAFNEQGSCSTSLISRQWMIFRRSAWSENRNSEQSRRDTSVPRDGSWIVQKRDELKRSASHGIAVHEFRLKQGHGLAGYLCFVNGKAVGVLEARPEGFTLADVEPRAKKPRRSLPVTGRIFWENSRERRTPRASHSFRRPACSHCATQIPRVVSQTYPLRHVSAPSRQYR